MYHNLHNNLDDIDIVILCGGLGTRLRSIVSDRPKVLAMINNRIFIDILIDNVKIYGTKNIILCVGYLKDQIKNHFNKNHKYFNKILFSEEEKPLGTGGALKNAIELIKSDPFMVMNGDSICNINYQDFYNFHMNKNASLSMVLARAKTCQDFGNIILDDSQRIINYQEKIKNENNIKNENKNEEGKQYLINAGIYLMGKNIISYMQDKDQFSLEYDLFPKLINENNDKYSNSINNFGFIIEGELTDIGTPERYKRAIYILQ